MSCGAFIPAPYGTVILLFNTAGDWRVPQSKFGVGLLLIRVPLCDTNLFIT